MCNLKIITDTIADNVTAPAIAPSTMPAIAPLLIPEDDEAGITASDTTLSSVTTHLLF